MRPSTMMDKLGDSWDHCPIYARIQEGNSAEIFSEKKKKEVDWMEAEDRSAKN